ncbi:MAG: glycosyltransferase family 4 protein [Chitinophagales bacterium]
MRIGFDAKRYFQNATGLGNYSRMLVHSLAKYYPQHEYLLFTPFAKNEFDIEETARVKIIRSKQKSWGGLWRSYAINHDLKRSKIDIFHGLSNEIPFQIRKTGVKTVVTIHDLIFKRFPNHYPLIDRNIYDIKSKYACKHADVIIATSQATKKDIIEFYDVNEQKIKVIYQSCDEKFFVTPQPDALRLINKKYNLPAEFILYVGSIIERKNLLNICKAYIQIEEQKRIPCVVIGRGGVYAAKVNTFITQNQLEKYFIFLKGVSNDEIHAFYQQAFAFVYPSKYEGFGIPVLEAMASGCPVITSVVSSMPEVAGDAALLVNPDSTEDISEAIQKLTQNENLRKQYAEIGEIQAQKFTAQTFAGKVVEIYNSIVI